MAPAIGKGRRGRPWLPVYVVGVLGFLYAPVVVLIVFAFNDSALAFSWQGFTLKWFRILLEDRILVTWKNSFIVSVCVVAVTAVMGTMAAYGLIKYRFPWKRLVIGFLFIPMIIPRTILGIALLVFLNFLGIRRSLVTVGVGQVLYVLPFVIIVISSAMLTFDTALEEAAMDLGADGWTTFRRVTFPLIKNGIMAGMLVAFILSFSEFTISFYLSGTSQTVPMLIFSEFRFLITPKINALSTAIVFITAVFTIVGEVKRGRRPLLGQ